MHWFFKCWQQNSYYYVDVTVQDELCKNSIQLHLKGFESISAATIYIRQMDDKLHAVKSLVEGDD